MKTIKHRFLETVINQNTETLIIGTFNPETEENLAEFFYGRSRNYLWRLLPIAYHEKDLKNASKQEKLDFISRRNIGFIDLISEIKVDEGQESNYYDSYIDSKVTQWRNVIAEMEKLKNIKRVCFTRKTFSDIPNMKRQIVAIQEYCDNRGIRFQALTTPARYYREDKQAEWTDFLLNGSR